MRIRIHNIRAGFATNSSSTHSIVLLPPTLVGALPHVEPHSEDGYGWDNFRLVTPEEKCRYLAALFFGEHWNDKDIRRALIERFAQEVPELANFLDGAEGYKDSDGTEYSPLTVDHQSALGLPTYNPTFVENMIRLFKSDRVVVLGGNDNGGDPEVPEGAKHIEALRQLRWIGRGDNRLRVRMEGHFCTFFDSREGTKIRFSFEADQNDQIEKHYPKASTPELVDLKITNFCDAGTRGLACAPFCYQASTEKGKHASFTAIRRAVEMMAEANVFEVAIGGGEPTTHPRLPDIIKLIAEKGMVPNFTTASTAWLDNAPLMAAVVEHVGGIGVSCHVAKDLRTLTEIKDAVNEEIGRDRQRAWWRKVRIVAQHVVGAVSLDETAAIIRACLEQRIPLLLLGYKETGFGAKHGRHDGPNSDLYLRLGLSELDLSYMDLSVDTALVQQHKRLLKALRVPDALVCPREGAFSCYVDATTGRMGPSSYVGSKDMTKLPEHGDDFARVFAGY